MRCYLVAVVVGLSGLCLAPGMAQAQEASPSVRSARQTLQGIDRWLGDSAPGKVWKEYLLTDRLKPELAKPQPDPQVLRETLRQLKAPVSGLDHPRFVKLRNDLDQVLVETAVASREDLPEVILSAKDDIVPPGPADLARAKQRLQSALGRLDRYLSRNRKTGQAWKEYLLWGELQKQLQAENPDFGVLEDALERYTSGEKGFELEVFSDVGKALEPYIDVAVAVQNPKAKERFEEDLDKLAAAVERYMSERKAEDAHEIGEILGRLESAGRLGWLTQAVRRHLSYPNAYLQVSDDLFSTGVEGPVDDVGPVTDVILGTNIRGTAHTRGRTEVRLVPNRRRAAFDTLLLGTTSSRTVGYNGPAVIHSTGNTSVYGRKRTLIDKEGFKQLPATSRAETRTRVNGVGVRTRGLFRGIVRNVARDRVYQNKSRGEYIAARHAEQRIDRRMDRLAGTEIAKANKAFREKFRAPLLRRNAFPEDLRFSSTRDLIHVRAAQADPYQLAAPTAPTEIPARADLGVRVHESLVNNLGSSFFSGLVLDEEKVKDISMNLFGEMPEELKADPDQEAWTMRFAKARPVTVVFDDGKATITLRGRRFTSGERSFGAMNISATYRVEPTPEGTIRLVRDEELEIYPPDFDPEGTETLSAGQTSLQRLLERRFSKIFKPEIVGEGLVLPGRWKDAGTLDLAHLETDHGWFSAAWNKPRRTSTKTAAR